jgi:hypothetical protein
VTVASHKTWKRKMWNSPLFRGCYSFSGRVHRAKLVTSGNDLRKTHRKMAAKWRKAAQSPPIITFK